MALMLAAYAPPDNRLMTKYANTHLAGNKTLSVRTQGSTLWAPRKIQAKVEVNSVPARVPEKAFRMFPEIVERMRDKTTHVNKCGGHGIARLATDACQAEALSNALSILGTRHRGE